jgi:hypothetical protein
MANALYENAKQLFLSGGIDLTSDEIRVAMLDVDQATIDQADIYYNAVSADEVSWSGSNGIQIPSTTITLNKSAGNCTFDGGNVTFTTVNGTAVNALVIFKWVTTAADSPLIAYLDTGTGLTTPIVPNGGDIEIQWNASGIFTW